MSSLICRRLFGAIGNGQHPLIYSRQRFYLSTSSFLHQKKVPENKYSRENVKSQVNKYVFGRFIDYVQNYDKLLEKKFPSAMHVYRVFLVGVQDFYRDMKRYLKVTRIVNGSSLGFRALTRKEIELYHQMPKDMFKVAPVLLLSALPFANYVIFPMAYMYPRLFLTSHFWSIQQKGEFQEFYLKRRLSYNLKVFRCMQAKLSSAKTHEKYEKWKYILGLLGSGLHPTSDEILAVNSIFVDGPMALTQLSSKHIKYLCYIHDIHRGSFRRARLAEKSFVIHHMDLAIKREGGVHNMPLESLRDSCNLRGLNTNNIRNEDMVAWLAEWVKVSLAVDGSNISLYLHLPVLIGYNHPNNWQLIYETK